jgi:hypothetical protein
LGAASDFDPVDVDERNALCVEEATLFVQLDAVDEDLRELFFTAAQPNDRRPERPVGFVNVHAGGAAQRAHGEWRWFGVKRALRKRSACHTQQIR